MLSRQALGKHRHPAHHAEVLYRDLLRQRRVALPAADRAPLRVARFRRPPASVYLSRVDPDLDLAERGADAAAARDRQRLVGGCGPLVVARPPGRRRPGRCDGGSGGGLPRGRHREDRRVAIGWAGVARQAFPSRGSRRGASSNDGSCTDDGATPRTAVPRVRPVAILAQYSTAQDWDQIARKRRPGARFGGLTARHDLSRCARALGAQPGHDRQAPSAVRGLAAASALTPTCARCAR